MIISMKQDRTSALDKIRKSLVCACARARIRKKTVLFCAFYKIARLLVASVYKELLSKDSAGGLLGNHQITGWDTLNEEYTPKHTFALF